MIVDANDETNFPQNLLLNNREVLSLRKAFTSNSSANVKLSKTRSYKAIQSTAVSGKCFE